jgi:predicted phosphoribosyltransferase
VLVIVLTRTLPDVSLTNTFHVHKLLVAIVLAHHVIVACFPFNAVCIAAAVAKAVVLELSVV